MIRPIGLAMVALLLAPTESVEEFRRTRIPGSQPELCLAWQVREYGYRIDTAGSSHTPGDAEALAIRASFDSWNALASQCSDFVFREGPPISDPQVRYVPDGENENVITFREASCDVVAPADDPCWFDNGCPNKYRCWDRGPLTIAITRTIFSRKTGQIFDADIEFNAAPDFEGNPGFLFTTISSPPCASGEESALCVATDVQNTLTHEIGHVVGLDHVTAPGSTMEASAPPGETQKRILDPGTARGFCHTYPRGRPPGPCLDGEVIDQQVVAINHGTPGLEGIGCSAGMGAPGGLLVLLLAWTLRVRRAGARHIR